MPKIEESYHSRQSPEARHRERAIEGCTGVGCRARSPKGFDVVTRCLYRRHASDLVHMTGLASTYTLVIRAIPDDSAARGTSRVHLPQAQAHPGQVSLALPSCTSHARVILSVSLSSSAAST